MALILFPLMQGFKMLKIKKVIRATTDEFGQAGRVEYHIVREDGSLLDVELDYGTAWVRMLVYENLEK
jgi:hypothetical protein